MKKQILLLFPFNHFFKNSLGMFLFDGEFFVFKEVVLKFIGKKNLYTGKLDLLLVHTAKIHWCVQIYTYSHTSRISMTAYSQNIPYIYAHI